MRRSTARVASLAATRPTAVNLRWALDEMRAPSRRLPPERRFAAALGAGRRDRRRGCRDQPRDRRARAAADRGRRIGARAGSGRSQILTHCNAGWLATVDWGTALAPIYRAHDAGIPLHVWVDETRPRNQGASLTAWELGQHGVPHTVIADNAGGHLMRAGRGRSLHRRHRPHDRRRRCRQQDRHLSEGAGGARQRRAVLCRAAVADDRLGRSRTAAQIPIEQRDPREVTHIAGWTEDGRAGRGAADAGRTARRRITPST